MMMLLIKQLKNVKISNHKGFTMLEMLFSFSIFCLIASLLPIMFQILFDGDSIESRIQKMEWELFISQLKKEIQSSDFVAVINGELTLTDGEETISYQPYQKVVRRRVDGKGHEVVLQNVETVSFSKKDSQVSVEVKDAFGVGHVAVIHYFLYKQFDGILSEPNE
jgi:competence protein ComGF